jgi:hypothetical protein
MVYLAKQAEVEVAPSKVQARINLFSQILPEI